MSKILLEHGWTPHIVTSKPKNITNSIETEIPDNLIHYVDWFDILDAQDSARTGIFRRIIHAILYRLFSGEGNLFDIRTREWINNAYAKSLEIISNNNIDVIFSSFSPSSSIRVGSKLKKTTGIPWVVEYRDLWTNNPYFKRSFFLQRSHLITEKRLVKQADALITVSKPLRDDLYTIHKKKTYVVYNGYDDMDDKLYENHDRKLIILHTGSIYSGSRDPSPLFSAIKELKVEGYKDVDSIEVHFYGSHSTQYAKNIVDEYCLTGNVFFFNSVPHCQIVGKQREADILLLLSGMDISEQGVLTAKIYEYMGRKKPILAIAYPHGAIHDILESTSTGIVLTEREKIKGYLKIKVEEKFQNGICSHRIEEEEVQFYSRIMQTKIMENILLDTINQAKVIR
jgi:hypothetical protein